MPDVEGELVVAPVEISGVAEVVSPVFLGDTAPPGGGGDVFLAVANLFTAMQSIDVDVPVTPLADAGTVKPTVLVHLHDDEGPRVDLWASSIDFGGGIVVSSAGRLTRRIAFDGEPTDIYLLESYAFVGISTITDEPLYRYFLAEVESSAPGEIPYLSDLFATAAAPIRVGEPTELDDAATKRYVDATVVAVGPNPPPEPADAASAVWIRTPGNLRAFADFRQFPDGAVDGIKANGAGSIDPPPVLASFTEIYPPFGGEPAVVTDGAVRSSGVPVDGPDPVPRTGFTFVGVAPGVRGRIEWGFAGFTETDGSIDTYNPTNVAISAPYDDLPEGAAGPHAYLGGFVVGKFVGDSNVIDENEEESLRVRLIRDDYGAPTTIASAQIARDAIPHIDRIGFTYDENGRFGIELNGAELATAIDTVHDLSTFTGIGMVMHQDYNAWLCGVEWFGISGGDEITGDLGPHRWTEEAGWVPVGPGARAALNAVQGGSGAVSSVNGETGAVTLSAADVGVLRPDGPAFHAVSSNAAMTALSAVRGDVCFRSDLDSTLYVLTSDTPTNLGDWTVLRYKSSTPVFPSEFTAKGDLLVATGAGTFAAVARGADGKVLKAKFSEAPGVEWGDAVTYGTTAGTAAQGNDSRLSDARTPTAHAASHAVGGSDPLTGLPWLDDFTILHMVRDPLPITGLAPTYVGGTQRGGGYVYTSATGWIWTFARIPLRAGTYTRRFVRRTDNQAGIVVFTIGGISAGSADGYAASSVNDVVSDETGIVIPSDGFYDLVMTSTTKNASSGNYRANAQFTRLFRTGA